MGTYPPFLDFLSTLVPLITTLFFPDLLCSSSIPLSLLWPSPLFFHRFPLNNFYLFLLYLKLMHVCYWSGPSIVKYILYSSLNSGSLLYTISNKYYLKFTLVWLSSVSRNREIVLELITLWRSCAESSMCCRSCARWRVHQPLE
jgi:hypothetical protein